MTDEAALEAKARETVERLFSHKIDSTVTDSQAVQLAVDSILTALREIATARDVEIAALTAENGRLRAASGLCARIETRQSP